MHKQKKESKNTLYITTTAILYVLELNKTEEKEANLNKYQYWDNCRNLSSFYPTLQWMKLEFRGNKFKCELKRTINFIVFIDSQYITERFNIHQICYTYYFLSAVTFQTQTTCDRTTSI